MPPETQQLQLFRAIRGAPATILLLLVVRGASMRNDEICQFTGYSDKPVTNAITVLEQIGFLQYNGRQHGWSLKTGCQLPLPLIHSLAEPVDNLIGEIPIYQQQIGETPIYAPQIGNIPICVPTTTTTIDPLDSLESQGSSRSKNGHLDRRNSDLAQTDRNFSDLDHSSHDSEESDAIAYWIRRAGVGTASRKYRELLSADLDLNTVRAHALERLAKPSLVTTGLFITRLLQGDPPPDPRCERCFKPLDQFGMCIAYCSYQEEEESVQ